MAAVQTSLPLNHFYRETLGSETLSQNLASNELFTPLQLDRFTVNPTRFEKYRSTLEKQPRLPWGRLREYGGMQEVQLPVEFVKPKTFPPKVVQKGHRHYGSGTGDPRDLKLEQYYDVTSLKKSHVRTSDQVLETSPSSKMNDARINLPFPAEHPYTSHMSRFSVFPKFDSPDDPITGDPARSKIPIHPDTPASSHPVVIMNKSKGSPYRRELQDLPLESKKEPLTWNGENDSYQLMKSVDGGKQPYYPTPPKIVHPNLRVRNEDQRLELRTVNALRNVEREQWKTTYDYNYTGNGPSNSMHLDDYHKKLVDNITSKEDNRNKSLIPATTPKFISPRPHEGRYARLYQHRRHVSADIRYPKSEPAPDSPDVMDSREYMSLPGTPRSLRRKDEWYVTGRRSADPALGNNKKDESNLSFQKRDQDEDDQWKTMQLTRHPDYGLDIVEKKKSEELIKNASSLNNEEISVKLPEVSTTTNYLKDYQDERNAKFENIENFHDLRKLELQYDFKHDMQSLRQKVDQVGNRLEPKAFDQHALQVRDDYDQMMQLRSRDPAQIEKYDTGLKFSTETISDRGTLTKLHDRQLEGHKEYAKPFVQDIPVTEYPPQNHKHGIASYVAKSNPFSMSHDSLTQLPEFRSKESVSQKASRTGSILKSPGSPPRVGTSRSISFNEVVKVATSEYGDQFKLTSSPLASKNEPTRSRCSTPFPVGARKEASMYPGISLNGPTLRPYSAFPHTDTRSQPRSDWRWNYDSRMHAEFEPLSWTPKSTQPRPQTSLLDIENRWSKSGSHKRLHESLPESAPDTRDHTRHYEFADRSADLRFHHSNKHKEKRHNFYGFNSYHFYNGNPIV